MNLILWIVFGAIAGWAAGTITKSGQGLLTNIVVGVIGAVVGGRLFQYFGGVGVTGFNLPSLLVAIVGAVVVLVILRLVRRGA